MRFFFLIIAFFVCFGGVGIGFCAPGQTSTIQVDGATVELGTPKGFIPATEGIYSEVISAVQRSMPACVVHAAYVSIDAQKTYPLYEYAIVTTPTVLSGKKVGVEDFAKVKEVTRSKLPFVSDSPSFEVKVMAALFTAETSNAPSRDLSLRPDLLGYFHETPFSISMLIILPGYLGGFPPKTALAAIGVHRLINAKLFTVFLYRPVKNIKDIFAFIAASENFMNELLPEEKTVYSGDNNVMELEKTSPLLEKWRAEDAQKRGNHTPQDTECAYMSPLDRILDATKEGMWRGAIKMSVMLLFTGFIGLAVWGVSKERRFKKTSAPQVTEGKAWKISLPTTPKFTTASIIPKAETPTKRFGLFLTVISVAVFILSWFVWVCFHSSWPLFDTEAYYGFFATVAWPFILVGAFFWGGIPQRIFVWIRTGK